jgi:hypothetical protein
MFQPFNNCSPTPRSKVFDQFDNMAVEMAIIEVAVFLSLGVFQANFEPDLADFNVSYA